MPSIGADAPSSNPELHSWGIEQAQSGAAIMLLVELPDVAQDERTLLLAFFPGRLTIRLPQAFCQDQDVLRIFVFLLIAMAQAPKPGPVALLAVMETLGSFEIDPRASLLNTHPADLRRLALASALEHTQGGESLQTL